MAAPGAVPAGGEGFAKRRQQLLDRAYGGVAGARPLTPQEADLDERVFGPVRKASAIDPAKSFLDSKADYDSSELLRLLHRMPKGAVLHSHGIASGDFRSFVDIFRANPRVHVWQGGDQPQKPDGTLRYIPEGTEVEGGWVLASTFTQDELYKYFFLPAGLPDVASNWVEFLKIWDRVFLICTATNVYFGEGGLLWSMFEKLLDAGITYFEIKEPFFVPWTDGAGAPLEDSEVVRQFGLTVSKFRDLHPGFVGARLVVTSIKAFPVEQVREHFLRAVAMKRAYPYLVAGFDLAGPEDSMNPISFYAEMLEAEQAEALTSGVDLPLHLHAGETNVPGAMQIVDAVALRSKRIGHGFALARHPALIEEVKALDLSLECCPISNQVLGYVPNLGNHPALGLMRAGVKIHISPDDPGFWNYCDPSYDFAAVVRAWNLGLTEVRALAINSLTCSTLQGSDRADAIKGFEDSWDAWVAAELERADVTLQAAATGSAALGSEGGA